MPDLADVLVLVHVGFSNLDLWGMSISIVYHFKGHKSMKAGSTPGQ
jgi:hypothetical protein